MHLNLHLYCLDLIPYYRYMLQCARETAARIALGDDASSCSVGLLRTHDVTSEEIRFQRDASRLGLEEYRACLAMEAGEAICLFISWWGHLFVSW